MKLLSPGLIPYSNLTSQLGSSPVFYRRKSGFTDIILILPHVV